MTTAKRPESERFEQPEEDRQLRLPAQHPHSPSAHALHCPRTSLTETGPDGGRSEGRRDNTRDQMDQRDGGKVAAQPGDG